MIETNIGKLWEDDVPHEEETLALMAALKRIDRLNGYPADDMLETGGDGDQGETLMLLLDVAFRQMKAESK